MKYILFLTLFFSVNSFAGPGHVVARHLQNKLALAKAAFANVEASSSILHTNDQEAYYLKRIRLMYAPFVAFDVKLFELKVMPIIEFRWTRKNPKGWVNYKR